MPLPIVSLDTIQSTISGNESLRVCELVSEQELLADFLQACTETIEDGTSAQEAFLVGACTVYRMLRRQAEAEDLL